MRDALPMLVVERRQRVVFLVFSYFLLALAFSHGPYTPHRPMFPIASVIEPSH